MKISEQLGLDPTVDRLHGGIICRSTGTGHGSDDSISGKEIVEGFGSINGTLIGVEDHRAAGECVFDLEEIV